MEFKANIYISDYWITCILDRHPNTAYQYFAQVDNECAVAENPRTINQYFNSLSEVKSKYQTIFDDFYNTDEKGYVIGQVKWSKVLSQQIRKTSHIWESKNQEWVSILEYVSAYGKVIPAYLIYKGKRHIMGNHNYEEEDKAIFGLSDTGWSDDKHGFIWFSTHFDSWTTTRTNEHHLLIIDWH